MVVYYAIMLLILYLQTAPDSTIGMCFLESDISGVNPPQI